MSKVSRTLKQKNTHLGLAKVKSYKSTALKVDRLSSLKLLTRKLSCSCWHNPFGKLHFICIWKPIPSIFLPCLTQNTQDSSLSCHIYTRIRSKFSIYISHIFDVKNKQKILTRLAKLSDKAILVSSRVMLFSLANVCCLQLRRNFNNNNYSSGKNKHCKYLRLFLINAKHQLNYKRECLYSVCVTTCTCVCVFACVRV